MPYGRDRQKREESEAVALDPIAMTIAIWLGVVVSVTALGRLAQDAQMQAATRPEPLQSLTQVGHTPQFMPLGS